MRGILEMIEYNCFLQLPLLEFKLSPVASSTGSTQGQMHPLGLSHSGNPPATRLVRRKLSPVSSTNNVDSAELLTAP
jgi:hypothetical protein